jgi:predicted ATP-dependent endonuclease of OLD family
MNKIAFNNFRRFQDFPTLELGKISIMVGRNNSGKSTMVKAILLVLDYLQNQQYDTFSFTNKSLEDANIVTFGRAKNNTSYPGQEVSFHFENENFIFSIFIYGNDDDTNASVSKIIINDTYSKTTFEINYTKEIINITKFNSRIVTKFDSLNDLIKEISDVKIELKKEDFDKKSTKGLRLIDHYNSLNDKVSKLSNNLVDEYETNRNDEIFNISYPLQLNFDNKTEASILEEFVSNFLFLNDAELRKLKEIRNNFAHNKIDTESIEKLLAELFVNEVNNYAGDESDLKKLEDRIQLLVDVDNYKSELLKSINKAVKSFNKTIIYYLGANPSKQSALFSIRDKQNNLAQAIHEFKQLKIEYGSPEYIFVKKWMTEFEIGSKFLIEFYAGEAYEFYVFDKDDKQTHLADKGMGSLQAMMLILKVATIIRKEKDRLKYVTVIVEEPELNLHPEFQGKLADFFHEVNKQYHLKFIIETHSEYLIRKSQNITVKESYTDLEGLNPNPFKLHYFDKANGPYEMKYLENGKFDRNFGEGFYDVASKSAMQLIQSNKNKG